jgi:hypothetical protein
MSEPTFQLPAGYASVKWGAPLGLTESTTMIGAAIIKSISFDNQIGRIKIEGRGGFVAGWVDMKAASAGAGGTKYDTEKVNISLLHGEHATKTWPEPGTVITVSGCTGKDTVFNGDWSIVGENMNFARKTEGDKGYSLERYCDVDLTPA